MKTMTDPRDNPAIYSNTAIDALYFARVRPCKVHAWDQSHPITIRYPPDTPKDITWGYEDYEVYQCVTCGCTITAFSYEFHDPYRHNRPKE